LNYSPSLTVRGQSPVVKESQPGGKVPGLESQVNIFHYFVFLKSPA